VGACALAILIEGVHTKKETSRKRGQDARTPPESEHVIKLAFYLS